MADLDSTQIKIISFRNERDCAQFHDPKNLDEALSFETGELLKDFLRMLANQRKFYQIHPDTKG